MLPTEISIGSQPKNKKKSINKVNLLSTPDTVPFCYIPIHAHIAGLYSPCSHLVCSQSLKFKYKVQHS